MRISSPWCPWTAHSRSRSAHTRNFRRFRHTRSYISFAQILFWSSLRNLGRQVVALIFRPTTTTVVVHCTESKFSSVFAPIKLLATHTPLTPLWNFSLTCSQVGRPVFSSASKGVGLVVADGKPVFLLLQRACSSRKQRSIDDDDNDCSHCCCQHFHTRLQSSIVENRFSSGF